MCSRCFEVGVLKSSAEWMDDVAGERQRDS